LISHSQFNVWNISYIRVTSTCLRCLVNCKIEKKILTYVCFYLSMNFIAWECNKVTWKLEPTWVDFMHSWFW